MANEIYINYPSGYTLKAAIRNRQQEVWCQALKDFEDWGSSGRSYAQYATIKLTDTGGDRYVGNFPTDIPTGLYSSQVFLVQGATYTVLGGNDIDWRGTYAVVVPPPEAPVEETLIDPAEVLAFVNGRLQRNESNIETELLTVLNELSDLYLLVGQDATRQLSAGDKSIACPARCKQVISIVLSDGTVDGPPLKRLSRKDYLQFMENLASTDFDQPEAYNEFRSAAWLFPPSDGIYTVKFDYYKRHAQDASVIEFGQEFRNAICFGAAYYVALTLSLSRYTGIWGPLYYQEIERRQAELVPFIASS